MAMKLSTTLSHITTVPNSNNSKVISEFYHYMKSIGTSENYQNQNQPYSEPRIAKLVFNIALTKKGNIPTSKRDIRSLSNIKNALKILVTEKKIIES